MSQVVQAMILNSCRKERFYGNIETVDSMLERLMFFRDKNGNYDVECLDIGLSSIYLEKLLSYFKAYEMEQKYRDTILLGEKLYNDMLRSPQVRQLRHFVDMILVALLEHKSQISGYNL